MGIELWKLRFGLFREIPFSVQLELQLRHSSVGLDPKNASWICRMEQGGPQTSPGANPDLFGIPGQVHPSLPTDISLHSQSQAGNSLWNKIPSLSNSWECLGSDHGDFFSGQGSPCCSELL